MILIKINRNVLKITIIIILAGFFGFNIYGYTQHVRLVKSYEKLIYNMDRTGKQDLVSFLVSSNSPVHRQNDVEIFDISKGEVIKKVTPNVEIREEAESFLNGITGMYAKVMAIPNKGYIIRIPFEPSVMVQNQWLKNSDITSVDQVFIIFPEQEKPYLLVLDNRNRPLFFNFEGNTDALLRKLDFQIKAP